MSPPRRRSSRIRGNKNTPHKQNETTLNHLATIGEQEGTPSHVTQSTLGNLESSPPIPNTPVTAGRVKPPREEMHPSKVRQSTQKEDDNAKLGFVDIGSRKPEILSTPSKLNMDPSSEFEFRFAKPMPALGPEAQQMMSEIREDARRIKAELAAKREEEIAKNGGDILGMLATRKIAQPKGKASRYSDVHMAEFKKMDSIAAHPSAFRTQPGRIAPVAKTLKRTQSKANLSDREFTAAKQTIKLVPQSSQNEIPPKRARQIDARDTSFARPSSRDANFQDTTIPSTPTAARLTNFLDSITTPTQSSLARAASNKHESIAVTPMRRSPSKIALTPGLAKSATMNNITGITRSESTHRFTTKMKSILRRPMASAEKQTLAMQDITQSSTKSPNLRRPNLNKDLPSVPVTPTVKQLTRSKSIKHVNFTPGTIMKNISQHSPTPLKSNIPRSKTFANLNSVAYPTLQSVPKDDSQLVEKRDENAFESTVTYPKLPKHHETSFGSSMPLQAQPRPTPGVFTFTSGHTIKFATPPRALGTSPGQASIRKVRPSILATAIPGSFPDNDKENEAPVVAHGLSNKKRARAASPCDEVGTDDHERSPKKRKGNVGGGPQWMAPKLLAEQIAPKSKIPSPSKKGGLSLSRLKMLATPKSRK